MASPEILEVRLPSGMTVPGVFLKRQVLELGPERYLVSLGDHIEVNGRRAKVMGFLRGERPALEGLWEAGPGRQLTIQWAASRS